MKAIDLETLSNNTQSWSTRWVHCKHPFLDKWNSAILVLHRPLVTTTEITLLNTLSVYATLTGLYFLCFQPCLGLFLARLESHFLKQNVWSVKHAARFRRELLFCPGAALTGSSSVVATSWRPLGERTLASHQARAKMQQSFVSPHHKCRILRRLRFPRRQDGCRRHLASCLPRILDLLLRHQDAFDLSLLKELEGVVVYGAAHSFCGATLCHESAIGSAIHSNGLLKLANFHLATVLKSRH